MNVSLIPRLIAMAYGQIGMIQVKLLSYHCLTGYV